MAKLLLVDDDFQVRGMMRETLEQEGYTVIEASDGKEAVRAYRKEPADLVIMDIIMPNQDGVESIHALRTEFPDIKIIAISGGSANIAGEHLLKTADTLGAKKTFNKPVDMNRLLETIEEMTN